MADFLAYERHGEFLDLTAELGHLISESSLEDALARINRSAFVITSTQRPTEDLVYPFDRTLTADSHAD
jgi:hypothetical protein